MTSRHTLSWASRTLRWIGTQWLHIPPCYSAHIRAGYPSRYLPVQIVRFGFGQLHAGCLDRAGQDRDTGECGVTAATSAAHSRNGGSQRAGLLSDTGWPEDDSVLGVGPSLFRRVMRHHAKGVTVITAGTEVPIGFCATSLASLSLDPPIVSFTVGLRTTSWATVETAQHVMVHLLADSQEDVARRFAQRDAAKFGPGTRWHRGALGLPVLDDVLAWLVLALVSHFPVGDHALVIGRVIDARKLAERGPLVHHNGEFVQLATPPQFSPHSGADVT